MARDIGPGDASFLKEVKFETLCFNVGSVHHDWVMGQEKHLTTEIIKHISGLDGCTAVDVGMNDGFYTQLFVALGCKVFSFEIQPRCIDIAILAAQANNFLDHITIFEAPVTKRFGDVVNIPMSTDSYRTCDGGFSIQGNNSEKRAHKPFEATWKRKIIGVSIDQMFRGAKIDFIKVDVEGHDIEVLLSASEMFREGWIEAMAIELQPSQWNSYESGMNLFQRIFDHGYEFVCLNDGGQRGVHNVSDCLDLLIRKDHERISAMRISISSNSSEETTSPNLSYISLGGQNVYLGLLLVLTCCFFAVIFQKGKRKTWRRIFFN